MALGILLVVYIVMFVLAFTCITLLLVSRKPKLIGMMIWVSTVFSLMVAYLSATSLPSNFVFEQILAWIFGGISIVGLVYHLKGNYKLAKFLVSTSIILGIVKLFFF